MISANFAHFEDDRRSGIERRRGVERRQQSLPVEIERRSGGDRRNSDDRRNVRLEFARWFAASFAE